MLPFNDLLQIRSALRRVAIPAGSMILMACDTTGPQTPGSLGLSVTTQGSEVVGGTGPNSLRISKVEFVLAQTEISRGGSGGPLTAEPLLVSLPSGARP